MEEKTPWGETLYASQYRLQIDQIIKGECDDTILFWQTGKPDSDDYETKIKKDTQYVLFLRQKYGNSTPPLYDAAGVEQGIVEIKPDNRLYSYTDEGFMANYDAKPTSILMEEITSCTN